MATGPSNDRGNGAVLVLFLLLLGNAMFIACDDREAEATERPAAKAAEARPGDSAGAEAEPKTAAQMVGDIEQLDWPPS